MTKLDNDYSDYFARGQNGSLYDINWIRIPNAGDLPKP